MAAFALLRDMTVGYYIDGFNLYYRALRGTASKWLDLAALCQRLSPKATVGAVHYFTARIQSRPNDPDQAQRQQAYLRAISTLSPVRIHFGRFLTTTVRMPLASPSTAPATVEVLKTEEKGSDVNLATTLLLDVFRGRFDAYAVISNDSDLETPIRAVRREFAKPMTVWVPGRRNPSGALRSATTSYRFIRNGLYARCQLPPKLVDAQGTITKPAGW